MSSRISGSNPAWRRALLGGSVAIAVAASGAVVLPNSPLVPSAVAQEAGQSENAAPQGREIIDADAIASGAITNATQLSNAAEEQGARVISGRAQIVTPKGGGQLTPTYDSFEPVPEGTTVYAQWIDKDGAVSPVYSAETHDLPGAAGSGGPGTYAFKLPVWTDADGNEHRFLAHSNQRYRIWVEPTVNPATGNELVQLRAAGGYLPYTFASGSGEGLGEFALTGSNLQRTGVWLY
ncbi:hypothetical protein [Corynebacterium otitidis]|uniref:Putative secreted protein n=1 Tax=Corynebacterium otitidis ATCC 51513 TaxID=883169 RepID=I7JVW4_9CORY|nr:hypothetical protein [Corynebacterium otitidis]EJZ82078.1 hypothetical protein HMPREF9719_00960 [Corynebacterium otitidis ATCC 51513]CCI83316.1 putative secreted protein [Corynebacterium otitidis ATCC 51513]